MESEGSFFNSEASSVAPLFSRRNKIYQKIMQLIDANKNLNFNSSFLDFDRFLEQEFSNVEEFRDLKEKKQAKDHSKDHRRRKELYVKFLEHKIFELLDYTFKLNESRKKIAQGLIDVLSEKYNQLNLEKTRIAKLFTANASPVPAKSNLSDLSPSHLSQSEAHKSSEKQTQLRCEIARTHLQAAALSATTPIMKLFKEEILYAPPNSKIKVSFLFQQHNRMILDMTVLNNAIMNQLQGWHEITCDLLSTRQSVETINSILTKDQDALAILPC